jgi:hypothetical protein
MAEKHEFMRLNHVAYGDLLVRVSAIVAIHQAPESGCTDILLATHDRLRVEEPFPVVSALLSQALGLP